MQLRFIGAMLIAAAVAAGGCRKAPPAAKKTVITFWQPFAGDVKEAMEKLRVEFERTHPGIELNMSYAANNLNASQKLFLAIAGGAPPDVTMVDGQQLAEWAARGALTDITDYVNTSGLTGNDFWLPRWKESMFAGRVYALPWGADPNFALLWSKKAFREAGLDPDRPPTTIQELDEYSRKLTKFDNRGRLIQLGIVPWEWLGDNSMFTWGYAFGGDFYEPPPPGSKTLIGKVTANHPKNVEALKWIASYSRNYDVRKIRALQTSVFGMATNNPFFVGIEAMRLFHVTELKWLHMYAPTLEYGVGVIPAPPDGEHPTGWIGGWSMAVPRGAKASAEAFEFIRWMCTSDEGTIALGKAMNQFPAYKKSPFFDTVKDDPDLKVFYEILKNSKHVRTLMPVQGYLMELLKRGVNKVLYEDADPQQVLDEITVQTQKRLEHVLRRVELQMAADGRIGEAR